MSFVEQLAELPLERINEYRDSLTPAEQRLVAARLFDWEGSLARPSQRRPDGEWSVWAINAGRGFGKTRTGAENVRRWAQEVPGARIAMIARTHSDLRDVMIEGRSGVLSPKIAPPWFRPRYEPSNRHVIWPNGSVCTTYTAEEPDDLRGPEFHFAWCDELATWRNLEDTWDNLKLALRVGRQPQTIVTTTPRPLAWLRKLFADPMTVVTGGSTYENEKNLPRAFLAEVERLYGGTTRGRQELFAEILDEAEGALWKRKTIDANRVTETPDLARVVVAIDPAVTSTERSDETGIVCVGSHPTNGREHFYVLSDDSGRYDPHGWATQALSRFEREMADRIVGEVNNGGDMIEATLRAVHPKPHLLSYKAVHASRGKYARAEPVAALYDQGLVHHVGCFDDLEDQLCNWVPLGKQRSPDRLDALVWAITELMGSGSVDEVTSIGPSVQSDRSSPWKV